MIKNKIRHLPARPPGALGLLSALLLVVTCTCPAVAGILSERDDNYQWRLCPPNRLIPVRPEYTDPATASDSTEIRADSSRLVEGGVSQFTGDVEVIRGRTSLRAEVVTYDDANDSLTAEGRTHIWDAGLTWTGESANYDLNSEQSTLYDGGYWVLNGRGRGHADLLHNDRQAQVTVLEDVDYSTCPQSDEAWRISASKITLDHGSDRGSATNAVLRVRDIPVFYFPYVNFPISDKRKSGFLAPTIGTTNDSGVDVRVPYYLNLAPNYDATLTPRVLTDRGAMLESEFRYLGQQYEGKSQIEYLPSDNLKKKDRYLLNYVHSHRMFDRRGRLYVLFNEVSDDAYFEDFGSSISTTSQRFLDRRLDFRYRRPGVYVSGLVQDYQTVDDSLRPGAGPYKRLPQLTARYTRAVYGGLQPGISSDATYFSKDASVTGGRVNLAPSLSYIFIKPYVDIRPKLTLRHTQYLLDDPNGAFDNNESRTLPVLSLDANLFAERHFSLFGRDTLQTLEPRVFYLLVPKVGQENLPVFDSNLLDISFRNLFRENRFSGGDRIGDANQVTAAISSRMLDTVTGREALRLSFGQTFYFRDREVTLPNDDVTDDSVSELIAEVAANLGADWSVRGTVQWDPNIPETDKSALSLRYRPNHETVINASYRFRRAVTDIEQTDVSMRIPILDNLALVGRWNYSLPDNRTLEAIGGIEYESCCWGLRVVARRFLRNTEGDFDTGIFMQIQFRGLGGFGRQAGSFLRRGIPGYEDPFD